MTDVRLAAPGGSIVYEDSADHFENGLLRLMNLTHEEFERWLALSEVGSGPLLERLADGWSRLRPAPPCAGAATGPVASGPMGMSGAVWHPAIAESPDWGVAVSEADAHAWLIRWDSDRYEYERHPPEYEEEYFEGDKLAAGGYGDYTAQSGWRLEKAARQVVQMRSLTGLTEGRVLDIGSGYGFFRVALRDAGYEQEGLEVSAFARAVAQSSYGLETHPGMLDDHWSDWRGRFDAATMFDLIEHVEDPDELLAQTAAILSPGGCLGIKTPNIDCPEAELFGAWYHSLKREHLGFFSPRSLTEAAARHGLEPVSVGTISHLLVGFVGRGQTEIWARDLRGADIDAWYRKVG
jgi:2-polyprenyl-3-methyl-5-hydroxy-6-metoxy-1,4-benzoquinol methylase